MTERGAAQPGHATPDALKRALTEHAAPDRLVVARGLFTGPSAAVVDDMYARIVKGQAHRERYALHLEKGATVDTNTYFGRLPASYFQRWTTVDEVQLKLVFDTSTSARVLLRGSDIHGGARTIDSAEVDGTGTAVSTAVPVPSISALSMVLAPPWMSERRRSTRALVEASKASLSCTSVTMVQRWK